MYFYQCSNINVVTITSFNCPRILNFHLFVISRENYELSHFLDYYCLTWDNEKLKILYSDKKLHSFFVWELLHFKWRKHRSSHYYCHGNNTKCRKYGSRYGSYWHSEGILYSTRIIIIFFFNSKNIRNLGLWSKWFELIRVNVIRKIMLTAKFLTLYVRKYKKYVSRPRNKIKKS